ncbi:2-phospho-L-lactate guanylyltransferase [Aeromicrobium fastidiosum]|uniref:2-phospho-L-lactate guanylyltransferase n=1 Tax=Aeromicrobium fastidiosum TaxID=52699 RepID=A0A641AQT9_9ACTN|nr:2-phospho-L-lactate guanylyltransferase [Aeromicrobium fastidiosum]KAA1379877.1 2-phospho-L-lactate guanylyltransferase [Aeromicrobium fastidiosum]MBP2389381.1 2-phospho-L-lactate guanylyltransferase [Aeromicrobium fastidiosum]
MNATVIVPVKPWALSKSRLGVDARRADLARAFALDVLEQVGNASSVGQLVIVSAEVELGSVARGHGAVLLTDRPMLAPNMLNVAIDRGRRWAMSRRPDAPVVVVPADLAALTAVALDSALTAMSEYQRAFVPDASDRGTTLSWAHDPALLLTQYGHDSAKRHVHDGVKAVRHVDPRVRQDVDTREDLREVRRLGVGQHTQAVLRELEALTRAPAPAARFA